MKYLITICIPTYNRASKVIRLLNLIDEFSCQLKLKVLVSNNASQDNTMDILNSFIPKNFSIKIFHQEINIGFDGNIRFLYQKAETEYVWFFSDDDLMFPDAIKTVLNILTKTKPDVLLFSFAQPKESKELTFNLHGEFVQIFDPQEIIRYVSKCPKISIFVMKKVEFDKDEINKLDTFIDSAFYFEVLSYFVLNKSSKPMLVIISKQLAHSDDEFRVLNYNSRVLFYRYLIYDNPFILKYFPCFYKQMEEASYYNSLQFWYSFSKKTLFYGNDNFFSKKMSTNWTPPFDLILLCKSPGYLIRYLLSYIGFFKIIFKIKDFFKI